MLWNIQNYLSGLKSQSSPFLIAFLLAVGFCQAFYIGILNNGFRYGMFQFQVSATTSRTTNDYFIICALGIQVVIFSPMNNRMSLTRGPLGAPNLHALEASKR
jgi:branched-chain amino acid transport system permease protein